MNGIYNLFDISKNIAYNSAFFCDRVMLDLVEKFYAYSWRKTLKRIFVYLDNLYTHKFEAIL
jgi:hypothetical protein